MYTEDDTFTALKREPFSSLLDRVIKSSSTVYGFDHYMEIVAQRKAMVAAAGWDYDEFNHRVNGLKRHTGKDIL